MIGQLNNAWYIVLYHGISWEENSYKKSIGGVCPPDYFRDHLHLLRDHGKLVSIPEGKKRLANDEIDEPLISLWFDDGLIGVKKYVQPLLEQDDLTGAISINSRFVTQEEFFWRYKLSYLNSIDAMRFLRSRLNPFGYTLKQDIRSWTVYNFDRQIVREIDKLFNKFTTYEQRKDAFRLFMSEESIREFIKNGWVIANHTAAHYPVGNESGVDLFDSMFMECEEYIESRFGIRSDYWVVPFGVSIDMNEYVSIADRQREDRDLVVVGQYPNTYETYKDNRVLYRIVAPAAPADQLIKKLHQVT